MKELLQFLGLPTSIAIVFATIVGVSVQIDKLSTKNAKADLSNFLLSADWIALSARLPALIQELFEQIFGYKHLSLNCIFRSAIFTLSSILILLVLGFINNHG
jgi:hypothetical protein